MLSPCQIIIACNILAVHVCSFNAKTTISTCVSNVDIKGLLRTNGPAYFSGSWKTKRKSFKASTRGDTFWKHKPEWKMPADAEVKRWEKYFGFGLKSEICWRCESDAGRRRARVWVCVCVCGTRVGYKPTIKLIRWDSLFRQPNRHRQTVRLSKNR